MWDKTKKCEDKLVMLLLNDDVNIIAYENVDQWQSVSIKV